MAFFKKSQKDINLIPEAEKPLKAARIRLVTTVVLVGVVALFIAAGVVLIALNFTENRKASDHSEALDKKVQEWEQIASVAAKATVLKTKSTQLAEVSKSNNYFAASLDKIRNQVPKGVQFSSLTVKSTSTLTLQATSSKAAEIQQFVQKMEEEKFFSSVVVRTFVKSSEGYILNLDLSGK